MKSKQERIRQISNEISRLTEELHQLTLLEDESDTFEIGDRIKITNWYRGKHGANKGSTGIIIDIRGEYAYFRLDSNGKTASRKIKNIVIID